MTYYRVFYVNYHGETKEYAHGLKLEDAEWLVSQLTISGFMAWHEEE